MKLKAVAAAAFSAVLAAGTATVGASTPPGTDPVGDDGAPGTDGSETSSPTTEVTTPVTIVVEPEPTTADGTSAGPDTVVDLTTVVSSADVGPTDGTDGTEVDQNQTAVITATIVADANTGSNEVITDDTGGDGSSPLAEIDTGDATAVGSIDVNAITQGAEVVLTDSATANLLQVALVINIGAALANTGLNAVSAPDGPGASGVIATGDADATGLDIEQYLTQIARQNADSGTDAASSQVAVSLWMGLALANTGTNAVAGTGVAASGGDIASGDASATGNDSLTEIEQYADILGVDQSTTNITQRATVLNVGFALANSGLNDVSNVATGLLTASEADDDAVAQQLFAMLLPAMLQSYGYGPAQGTIASGDATAVGNESDTFVRQVALAAASGDGQIDIVQDVLVANMGAAAANTGGNTLGSVRPLDQETADAVVTMAAFMAELLSLVHRSANEASLDAHSQGIEIPFQGLILRLDGAFQGLDAQFAEGGARANVRQVSVIVSLGIAEANTGGNVSQADVQQGAAVNALQAGDAVAVLAVDDAGNAIMTGDAAAANREVVVVCQRINADDLDCLAPPTTTLPPGPTTSVAPATTAPPVSTAPPSGTTLPPGVTVPPTTSPPRPFGPPVTAPPGGTLPATGSTSDELVAAAMTALLLGGFLVVITRKRTLP
ncbi:LPXTG cell wall anchor domain-containing protein [Desertimonas flava]|uniref:LPXTG cell wall anchor domain-containing protein n=1 Tax=Desertimonas flava TaxID=2064846 RepID=UPI000E347606|nr:LPXTG cell wall anchor domain-containing protein [Desertimonas flava]